MNAKEQNPQPLSPNSDSLNVTGTLALVPIPNLQEQEIIKIKQKLTRSKQVEVYNSAPKSQLGWLNASLCHPKITNMR